jgi:hypothetical protein
MFESAILWRSFIASLKQRGRFARGLLNRSSGGYLDEKGGLQGRHNQAVSNHVPVLPLFPKAECQHF